MERFFSELRNKPYRYRRNVALGVAVVVTLVIFSVWAVSTKERFEARLDGMAQKAATNTATSTASGASSTAAVEPASPFEAISQTFSEGFDTIEKQFEELSKLAE
ncbi:MAG: hypothetical protein AAB391_01695 [Patescibacteria group bacterium]